MPTAAILAAFLMPVPICWPALNARPCVSVSFASNLPRARLIPVRGLLNASFSSRDAMSFAVSAVAMSHLP
jgi:hypothetical protein